MNNKESTKKEKVLKWLLGGALILGLLIPSFGINPQRANAQATTTTSTDAHLRAQINTLLALVSQLQAIIAGQQTGGTPTTPSFVFTSDLTLGSTGAQVTRLQQFLVTNGYLVMPTGVAYGYFGTLTQAALSRFQAAQSISPTAGYFGPITRARINAILAAQTPTTPPTTGTTTPTTGGITTPGVEGIMTVSQTNAGISSTIYEGQTGVAVLGMRVEARTSDIAVQRVRVNLGTNSTLYNRVLSRIYLSEGNSNTSIASRDLNSSNVIREGDNYFIDLTGFSYIVPKETSRDLVIRADVRTSIDQNDRGSRSISLANNGVRGTDGAGIDHYGPSFGSSVSRSFSVQESLSETATLRLSLNNSTPRAQNVVSSSGVNNNEIDRLTLLTFDLRAERADIVMRDLRVNISKSGSGSANASSTLYLYDGSREIDNTSVNGDTAVFSNIDYNIPINTTRTLSVRADIRNSDINPVTFSASASSSGITAENNLGDSIDTSDITGSAIGYPVTVRNVGPEISLSSASITTNGAPQFGGTSNMSTSTLTATFNLRIRAVGEDLILGTAASTSPAFGSTSGSFQVYRNGASDNSIGSAATSTSFSIPSGSNTSGLTNSFRIPEGTEVSIPVTFQILGRRPDGSPLPTGIYSIGFEGFRWQGGGTINTTNFMSGLVEWRTSDVSFP